jgi:hypothetical protein
MNGWHRVPRKISEDEVLQQERDKLAVEINARETSGPELDPIECRRCLEAAHGQVWSTMELAREFEVEAFSAPLIVAIRRCDGVRGTLIFQHEPRFYWGFTPA